ncbi:MAG: hypothetical protein IKE75_03400 [Bacilli bacterium]|nr:hypothetical protein [Bacilli bacterium]
MKEENSKQGIIKNFAKNEKSVFTCIVVIIILIITNSVTLFFVVRNNDTANNVKKDENSQNINTAILEDASYKDLKFSNFVLAKRGKVYLLTANVMNEGKDTFNERIVDIAIKNKAGKTIAVFRGYIGQELVSNDSQMIRATCSSDIDLSNAWSKEITEHKTN